MKRIALFFLLFVALMTATPAAAQMTWTWGGTGPGSMAYWSNGSLNGGVSIKGDFTLLVGQGFTLRAPQAVKGSGFTLTKKGGGRFWLQANNPDFDCNIVYDKHINPTTLYREESDTIQLDGYFGSYIDATTGYLFQRKIYASNDSTSLFYLHQQKDVVQTFDASDYNDHASANLHILSDTKSTLRLIKSSGKFSGKVSVTDSGTLYIDGTHNADINLSRGRLITGQNSYVGTGHEDYATFANLANNGTAITVSNSAIMQIGASSYVHPSLVNVTKGHVKQENGSTLEIDIYNSKTNWNLTTSSKNGVPAGFPSDWSTADPYSDKIYLDEGDYIFGTGSKIKPTWHSTAFIDSVAANDSEFYLPVIMLKKTTNGGTNSITGAANVAVEQTLQGWELDFVVANGEPGTTRRWGYIHGRRIIMKKDAEVKAANGTVLHTTRGTESNPVVIAYSDIITYTIKVWNLDTVNSATITVTDTLPPYLTLVPESISAGGTSTTTTSGAPVRDVVTWTTTIPVPKKDTVPPFTFKATLESGASASQPLFINVASANINTTANGGSMNITVLTNETYHQGAGASLLTFSASSGGMIFNAQEQALDYNTTPRAGVMVAPDNGFEFAGWSYNEYTSLRGEKIPAAEGIMNYEDIVVYGNVELRADFAPAKKELSVENPKIEEIAVDNNDLVWAHNRMLYIRAAKGQTVCIYTTDGILRRQFVITSDDDTTTVQLERGVYVVTLGKNGVGNKVRIE